MPLSPVEHFQLMTTPNQLTLNFKDLFEQQEAIEKDPVFQAKKNEYKDRV